VAISQNYNPSIKGGYLPKLQPLNKGGYLPKLQPLNKRWLSSTFEEVLVYSKNMTNLHIFVLCLKSYYYNNCTCKMGSGQLAPKTTRPSPSLVRDNSPHFTKNDWVEILSADCPVGALPHLVCCVEAMMVVAPQIPWEWGGVFLKIQGCYGPPVGCGWVHLVLFTKTTRLKSFIVTPGPRQLTCG
jgi:hypothetical protein